ncbi:MAG: polyprenyl synthetase family protein [Candidatus Binatia bacterium]|nr:polyprenyl synthetase family protein [Candidatus Binatia bacterium]
MRLDQYLEKKRRLIDRALDRYLPATSVPDRLVEAMRYSLLGGGKRVRPILSLAACEAVGGNSETVLPFACAIEMIHTYSLIHDDLPAMDNDELRRGRPTNHIVFGEALAILAGDALLTEAFRIMGEAALSAGVRQRRALQVLTEVAMAAGPRGLVGGQAADIAAQDRQADLPLVEYIHVRKTGELIRVSVRAGAILGGARPGQLRQLSRYAEFLGLAFQIADDILDEEGSLQVTGKIGGGDRRQHKATFPAVLGLPASKQRVRELLSQALEELDSFGDEAEPLRQIAQLIVARASVA